MRQAEVSLMMVFELYHAFATKTPEKLPADNPYVAVTQKILNIDFLVYNSHLTTNQYLESIVRYAVFFQ